VPQFLPDPTLLGRGSKPSLLLPCVVRRCPTTGSGGGASRPGAAAAIVRHRYDGRHATGGGGSDAAVAAEVATQPIRQRGSRIRPRQPRVPADI